MRIVDQRLERLRVQLDGMLQTLQARLALGESVQNEEYYELMHQIRQVRDAGQRFMYGRAAFPKTVHPEDI